MGCCCSWLTNRENKSQSGEPNERTTLLGNPVSNNIGRQLFNQDFAEVVNGTLRDEQAALNKILQQNQIDIIDVSAIPTHIEQKDYMDRVRVYQRCLASVRLTDVRSDKCLLRDLPHPEKLLSDNPIMLADLHMMDEFFNYAYQAINELQIESKENIISKFGVS